MKCMIRTERGICGKPATDTVKLELVPHDYIHYVKEIKFQDAAICPEHLEPIKAGWHLRGQLVFRWTPPTS